MGVKIALPDFEVYPNPTTGELTLNWLSAGESYTNIRIFKALGEQMVLLQKIISEATTQLDISHLADGIYTIQLTTSGGIPLSKRIVLAKTGRQKP